MDEDTFARGFERGFAAGMQAAQAASVVAHLDGADKPQRSVARKRAKKIGRGRARFVKGSPAAKKYMATVRANRKLNEQ